MKKSDVKRSYHQGSQGWPMINVKCHNFPGPYQLLPHFPGEKDDKGFASDRLEKASQVAWEDVQFAFWEVDAPEIARDVFGDDAKVYGAGRMGGWLVIDGLPEVDTWNGGQLAKWSKFERSIGKLIKALTSLENVKEFVKNYIAEQKHISSLKASARAKLTQAECEAVGL